MQDLSTRIDELIGQIENKKLSDLDRYNAVDTLSRLKKLTPEQKDRRIAAFLNVIGDKSDIVQAAALEALGKHGDKSELLRPVIRLLSKMTDVRNVNAAIDALVRIEHKTSHTPYEGDLRLTIRAIDKAPQAIREVLSDALVRIEELTRGPG